MIEDIEQDFNKKCFSLIPIRLENIIRTEGEQGIIYYLSTIKMEDISADLILLLDALRSALKYFDNTEDPALLHIFNNCRKYEHAE